MSMIRLSALAMLLSCLVIGCGGGTGSSAGGDSAVGSSGSSTGGLTNPVCAAGTGTGEVQAPVFVRNLGGQTGWFASPVVADLDGDGSNELIAAY